MPKNSEKYGTEAVAPGDAVMEEGGCNFVNQTERKVVEHRYVNSSSRRVIRNHIFKREVGMTLSSFADGKLMEIGCKGDVKSKRYIGFFKIFKRADRVHVIGVSEHDHTIVSPVFVRVDRAVPVEGTVSLTVRLRVTSEENLSFYEDMLNSSYVSHDHNYHYNESAIIMTDSDFEKFWRHSLQNSIREPMSDQRLVFENLGALKQRFINYLTHDPIFQHFEIVSADVRFGINEWEKVDYHAGEKEREVEIVSIDSGAKVAKIRIAREEYGAMRGGGTIMEPFTAVDLIKIGVTVLSLVFLYLFRRKIIKFLSDAFVGGDTGRYQEESIEDIRNRIERTIREVLE